MTFDRGEVWWGPAPHKSSPAYRPWLIVNTSSHPFARTECIVLAMTTQRHEEGVRVPGDGWRRGGSEKESYVSPWYVTTIKHRDFDDQQGALRERIVDTAVSELHKYTTSANG